jgi:hypothetical protein
LPNSWREENEVPFFAKKGWTRPKENAAKHPLKGADGVVVSSYRLFIPNGFDKRWLETTLYERSPLLWVVVIEK